MVSAHADRYLLVMQYEMQMENQLVMNGAIY